MKTDRQTTGWMPWAMRRFAVGPVCLAALLTGCSTFHRDWKQAGALPAPTNEIVGRWQGGWSSDINRHKGRLRCLITREPDGGYTAHYHAKYGKILSFSYSVRLEVAKEGEIFTFKGEANLGSWAGGMYRYEGRATPTRFTSTYRCKSDHGTFDLTRPGPE